MQEPGPRGLLLPFFLRVWGSLPAPARAREAHHILGRKESPLTPVCLQPESWKLTPLSLHQQVAIGGNIPQWPVRNSSI